MQLAQTRSLFFLTFAACAVVVGTVLYLQRAFGLSPCVLCVWQRSAFILSGIIALIAALHAPRRAGYRTYAAVLLLIILAGAAIAGGQVWLQTASDDDTIKVVAWAERLLDIFLLPYPVERLRSDATFCAEISWSLFGISLPEWSLLAFVGLALIMLCALFRASGRAPSVESRAED